MSIAKNIYLTFFSSLIFGILAALYAKRTGKNPYLWFLLGMLLGCGVFLLLFMPKRMGKSRQMQEIPIGKKIFWYYLDGENRQRGPFEFDVLKQAWQRGTVTSETYVWNETLEKWEPFALFQKSLSLSRGMGRRSNMAYFDFLVALESISDLTTTEVGKVEVYGFGYFGFVISHSPKAFVGCEAFVAGMAEPTLNLTSILGLAVALFYRLEAAAFRAFR